MGYHEHKKQENKKYRLRRNCHLDSRTEETDESGKLIKQRLLDRGHKVVYYCILKMTHRLSKIKSLN